MDRAIKNLQLMLHREYGIEVRKADLLRYAISQLDEFDKFYSLAVDCIVKFILPGVDRADLLQEIESFL